jgi:hypothetical protein
MYSQRIVTNGKNVFIHKTSVQMIKMCSQNIGANGEGVFIHKETEEKWQKRNTYA